jgi:dipeptidyl aminopeptidase/acylaminoacyl peptidase
MLVHGTADTDVPYEQSKLMADRLGAAGVDNKLVPVRDGAHGISNLTAGEQTLIYQAAAEFLFHRV